MALVKIIVLLTCSCSVYRAHVSTVRIGNN